MVVKIVINHQGKVMQIKDFGLNSTSLNKVKEDLTITHINKIGMQTYKKTLEIYIIDPTKKYLTVPRFYPLSFKDVEIVSKIPDGLALLPDALTSSLKLLESQKLIKKHLIEQIYTDKNIKTGEASCILVVTTGGGKTYIAGSMIGYFGVKALVVTPNLTIIGEWLKMFKACYPNLKIGQYNSKVKEDGDVVIMTINSTVAKEFKFKGSKTPITPKTYFKQFGAIIMDEVHEYPTSRYHGVFQKTNFKYGLYLTATPDERFDKMDKVYYKHAGPIVNAVDIVGDTQVVWKGKITAVLYNGPEEFTKPLYNSIGWLSTSSMLSQFIEDNQRNEMIIDFAHNLYKKKMNVYIFSERRNHLEIMDKMIAERNIKNHGILMGGVLDEDKLRIENEANIILVTYGYGVKGLSIDKMDGIILASPRKSKMRQCLGRILRVGGDTKKSRIIIDIIDASNSTFMRQYKERCKIYLEKNWDISEEEISV